MRFAPTALMPSRSLLYCTFVVASLFICSSASAQQPPDGQTTPAQTQTPQDLQGASAAPPKQLDQTLVNLPTTLRLKKHHSYFRITHRFARDLRRGTFGQLAEDLFSLDNGAVIGLEYRFGITDSLQAGINRSILGKTMELFGRFDGWQQTDARPFGLSGKVSVEGQNNLRVDPQPGVTITLSHVHGPVSLYASPAFIKDAHTPTLRLLHEGHQHTDIADDAADADAHLDQNDTAYVGLGVRVHIRPTVSTVFEISPRVYGYRPDRAAWSAAIEKLTRGHVLQLNFSNSFGTTAGQIARGGSNHDVYMGFNLSRKF
jgi:hypothetical protein